MSLKEFECKHHGKVEKEYAKLLKEELRLCEQENQKLKEMVREASMMIWEDQNGVCPLGAYDVKAWVEKTKEVLANERVINSGPERKRDP